MINPDSKELIWQSPDEFELVVEVGKWLMDFTGRDSNNNVELTEESNGQKIIHTYKCLNVLEFDSARKMMSIIVQDTLTKKIEVLTKGADSFVEEKLTQAERANKDLEKCKKHILRFAETGLRTLMLAKREIPQEVYDEWALRRTAAEQAEENRQEKIDEVNAEMERDLVLVGSTAIEDRL
jgi:magnesium-transporting ATPase (P-type)